MNFSLVCVCFFQSKILKSTIHVTFVVRKDTRSPGPHYKCHLLYNFLQNINGSLRWLQEKKNFWNLTKLSNK